MVQHIPYNCSLGGIVVVYAAILIHIAVYVQLVAGQVQQLGFIRRGGAVSVGHHVEAVVIAVGPIPVDVSRMSPIAGTKIENRIVSTPVASPVGDVRGVEHLAAHVIVVESGSRGKVRGPGLVRTRICFKDPLDAPGST